MKKISFVLLLLITVMLTACSKDEEQGTAPSSLSGKTLTIESCWFDFNYASNGNVTVQVSSEGRYFVDFKGVNESASVHYDKNGDNSAVFSAIVPCRENGLGGIFAPSFSSYKIDLSLYFLTPSEGLASGTIYGQIVTNAVFTIL